MKPPDYQIELLNRIPLVRPSCYVGESTWYWEWLFDNEPDHTIVECLRLSIDKVGYLWRNNKTGEQRYNVKILPKGADKIVAYYGLTNLDAWFGAALDIAKTIKPEGPEIVVYGSCTAGQYLVQSTGPLTHGTKLRVVEDE